MYFEKSNNGFSDKIKRNLNSLDLFYKKNKLYLNIKFCEVDEQKDIYKRKI